jgi:hypothetical protein
MDSNTDWRKGADKLSQEEQLEVVNWLFSLHWEEWSKLAATRLQKSFPTAPPEMLKTAQHHLYVDGKDDALLWLAELALYLKDPNAEPPSLAAAHRFLYHLYNWFQFRALLPEGKPGLLALVKETKQFVEEGDHQSALASLQSLEETIDGNLDWPQFH